MSEKLEKFGLKITSDKKFYSETAEFINIKEFSEFQKNITPILKQHTNFD